MSLSKVLASSVLFSPFSWLRFTTGLSAQANHLLFNFHCEFAFSENIHQVLVLAYIDKPHQCLIITVFP